MRTRVGGRRPQSIQPQNCLAATPTFRRVGRGEGLEPPSLGGGGSAENRVAHAEFSMLSPSMPELLALSVPGSENATLTAARGRDVGKEAFLWTGVSHKRSMLASGHARTYASMPIERALHQGDVFDGGSSSLAVAPKSSAYGLTSKRVLDEEGGLPNSQEYKDRESKKPRCEMGFSHVHLEAAKNGAIAAIAATAQVHQDSVDEELWKDTKHWVHFMRENIEDPATLLHRLKIDASVFKDWYSGSVVMPQTTTFLRDQINSWNSDRVRQANEAVSDQRKIILATGTAQKDQDTSGSSLLSPSASSMASRQRKAYKCSKCGQPKRGHICQHVSTGFQRSVASLAANRCMSVHAENVAMGILCHEGCVRDCENQLQQDAVEISSSIIVPGEKGLFAKTNIKKGTFIATFGPLERCLGSSRCSELPCSYEFPIRPTGGGGITRYKPSQKGSEKYKAHFVNHQCDIVNCNAKYVQTETMDGDPLMVVQASKDIEKGTEIFVCYGTIGWGKNDYVLDSCLCFSCRNSNVERSRASQGSGA